jgi:hypothetical protein
MNSQQVQDIRLMYEAVYNDELREKAEEYNNQILDEEVVEVATEYFYTYGLNEDGINILIEKVGLDNFVEFVYDLSEGLILTEARKTSKAKKQPSMLASQRAKLAAQKAATERTETEKKEPESKGADTEAKSEQPKSKKPEKGGIRGAIERGMERHRLATTVASKVAQKAGPALGKGLMHGVGGTLGLIGKIASSGLKEEFEYWVNSLIEEGYDLSDYTWDDMYDIYLDEAAKRTPRKQRGAKPSDQEWQRGRSDAGKRVSGDEDMGPRKYSLGRRVALDAPTKPGERPQNTPRLADWEKDDIQYRKANLKAGKTHKVGGEKGLPESYDNFDIILEYLVAEGYADTNEDALAIMANMSEEWREDILESFVLPTAEKSRRINTFLNNSLGHLKLYSKQIDTAQQELADKKPPTYSIGKLVKKNKQSIKKNEECSFCSIS